MNNHLEQDHRGLKQRYRPMCGLKTVTTAERFCYLFDELRAFLRPQSGAINRDHWRRDLHQERFPYWLEVMAAV